MLMEKIYKDLNDRQLEAVKYIDSPLLILAGAGSGKTRVLTYKIYYLIKNKLSYPENIFAVTFTNKAADEMKKRVETLLNINLKNMMIGTFHSMCVKIIKMHRASKKLDLNFSIYDTDDGKNILKSVLKELGKENIDVKTIQKKISYFKNRMIFPEEIENYHSFDIEKEDFKKIYNHYQMKLKDNNAYDFDDLLLETIKIFNDDNNFKENFSNRIKFILVDEYQDTNLSQFYILKHLYNGKNNITVVGDDDQSIYSFRGAELKNILDFEKHFENTKIIKLEQNYRSTNNILNVANRVIRNNLQRKDKILWSLFNDGEKVKIVKCFDERQEATYVVQRILQNREREEKNFSDFVILYRTNAQSRPFEEILRKNNINYKVIGNIKFFERKEIKDILAYLSFIINKNDEISFRRIMNFPKKGMGEITLNTIIENSTTFGLNLYDSLKKFYDSSRNRNKIMELNKFFDLIKNIENRKENVYNALGFLIDNLNLDTVFEKMDTNEKLSRLENIQELLNSAKEFVLRNEDNSIDSYMDMISLYTDMDEYNDNDTLTLMTVHNAKGLEFDTVFVTGVEEKLFPHMNTLDYDQNCEEERRLFYVALTRAKKNLYITMAKQRKFYGTSDFRRPSRFLKEIGFDSPNIDLIDLTISKQIDSELFDNDDSNGGEFKEFFDINDRIVHPIFGEGVIKGKKGSGKDQILIIQFLNGEIKKIFSEYANLTRK